jgi:hypothetical protein
MADWLLNPEGFQAQQEGGGRVGCVRKGGGGGVQLWADLGEGGPLAVRLHARSQGLIL